MSETFASEWLELREPVDHRSRAGELLEPLREWWAARKASAVLDLGCGTGSNLRYLAPRLPRRQEWTVLDRDARLLGRVTAPVDDVEVRPLQGELAHGGIAQVAKADLVTASALLDLGSASWLDALAGACAAAGAGALFALSYDGTIEWGRAADPTDELLREAVNEHQHRDKGLGPALGPTAARTVETRFRELGYRTWLRPSPWELGRGDAELARRLVDGWATAATEQRPDESAEVRSWARRRREVIARGDFTLLVGHQDVLALPV